MNTANIAHFTANTFHYEYFSITYSPHENYSAPVLILFQVVDVTVDW